MMYQQHRDRWGFVRLAPAGDKSGEWYLTTAPNIFGYLNIGQWFLLAAQSTGLKVDNLSLHWPWIKVTDTTAVAIGGGPDWLAAVVTIDDHTPVLVPQNGSARVDINYRDYGVLVMTPMNVIKENSNE